MKNFEGWAALGGLANSPNPSTQSNLPPNDPLRSFTRYSELLNPLTPPYRNPTFVSPNYTLYGSEAVNFDTFPVDVWEAATRPLPHRWLGNSYNPNKKMTRRPESKSNKRMLWSPYEHREDLFNTLVNSNSSEGWSGLNYQNQLDSIPYVAQQLGYDQQPSYEYGQGARRFHDDQMTQTTRDAQILNIFSAHSGYGPGEDNNSNKTKYSLPNNAYFHGYPGYDSNFQNELSKRTASGKNISSKQGDGGENVVFNEERLLIKSIKNIASASPATYRAIFNKIDENHDKSLNETEFRAFWSRVEAITSTPLGIEMMRLWKTLKHWEKDPNL